MSSIERSGAWNPGGGNWIEVLPVAHVASYDRPMPTSVPIVVPKPGLAWMRIYCTQGTLEYREKVSETDNGDLHEIQIRGFSPDDGPVKAGRIYMLKQYKHLLVRFRDNARLTRLAGTPIEHLLFSYELATEASVAGSRGYNLQFSGTLTMPAAYE